MTASTGNTDGFFYVRVQGHGDADFNPNAAFGLDRTTTGGAQCDGLETSRRPPSLAPPRNDADTVIVTDTNKIGLADDQHRLHHYLTSLGRTWPNGTDGDVVDVHGSAKVVALQQQVGRCTRRARTR